MPFWPFSTSWAPNNKGREVRKEDWPPWQEAIIPYLQFKKVILDEVTIHDSEFEVYRDPPETNFMTQFEQLKLFLDAKLLDENGHAWKGLKEADPGFRKIRMLVKLFDYYKDEVIWDDDEEPVTTFPEYWKNEVDFVCWLYVNNIYFQLWCFDMDMLEKAIQVIMHSNCVQIWHHCDEEDRKIIEELLAKRDAEGAAAREKYKKQIEDEMQSCIHELNLRHMDEQRKLEKERKKQEEKLLKEKKKQEEKLLKEKKKQEEKLLKETREQRRLEKDQNHG